MKKLLSTFVLILITILISEAQNLGDKKTDILKKYGTPISVKENSYVYKTEGNIYIFEFANNKLISHSIHRIIPYKLFKKLAKQYKQVHGIADGYVNNGELILIRWDFPKHYLVLAYNVKYSMVVKMILDKRFRLKSRI